MLEGCRSRNSKRFLELLDKLPGVEGIKEIDLSGTSAEDLDGKLASVVHINLCRLLIGVTTVFKFKFFHFLLLFQTVYLFLLIITDLVSPLSRSI